MSAHARPSSADRVLRTGGRCRGSHQNHGGPRAQQMLQRPCDVLFLFRANQRKDRVGPESFQPLPRHALEQGSRPLAVVRIGVKQPYARSPDRARLENRPAFAQNRDQRLELWLPTAKGALFTVATRWPPRAKLKLGFVAMTTLACS